MDRRGRPKSILPLLNEKGKLAIIDMEKAEVLDVFVFTLVFAGKASPRPYHETSQ